MAWFEHNGGQIYYEEQGVGEPVLLLPGWGGSIDEFSGLRDALAVSYRVIAADLPGSGKSAPQPRHYTETYLQDDAQAFLGLLAGLTAGPTHLMGFSDGGEDALLMAALQPESARSIVTWGAAGHLIEPPGMLDAFYDLVDNPKPQLAEFADYLKASYGEANARIMTQTEAAALRTIIQAGGDISLSRAGKIGCQALLITGEHDFLAPPEAVLEMAQAIAGGRFLLASNAGHDVHNDCSDWLVGTILDWLAKA